MNDQFDIRRFATSTRATDQYERQLARLQAAGHEVHCIERAVRDSLANLQSTGRYSFVIYGEPQSGKTEMMICLTAKLLDLGYSLIVHLLNDSVDLLGQNLGRFQDSGIAPAAKNYTDILDPAIKIKDRTHVIFCKKNSRDLQRLINKIGTLNQLVVIDDEADFASPNSKINKNEQTKINELITVLLGEDGDYIGVTATPARLDLNNTFDNDNSRWVNFPPHKLYTGQDIFFPIEGGLHTDGRSDFQLTLLPDAGDDPKHPRRALFGFLVNVAYINLTTEGDDDNYSMLVHTSGKKVDHKSDWATIESTLSAVLDPDNRNRETYLREIWELAAGRYTDLHPDRITRYIIENISRNTIIILNSDRDFRQNGKAATNPSALFTIIIGGNIVSRGVTFDNLLSMFFTRDVKHKIQQDTYIQRARMFGARGKYLSFFELTIPAALYTDWHRCFVFHKLALEAIKEGIGSPVWLSDKRIAAVASSSIDKSTVDLDKGEMAFRIFDFDPELDQLVASKMTAAEKLELLSERIGEAAFPSYLMRFITRTSPGIEWAVAIHTSSSIEGYKDEPGINKLLIERRRGFFGNPQLEREKFPSAIHHLKVFTNSENKGRLFYKFDGSIQFIKNLRLL